MPLHVLEKAMSAFHLLVCVAGLLISYSQYGVPWHLCTAIFLNGFMIWSITLKAFGGEYRGQARGEGYWLGLEGGGKRSLGEEQWEEV
ncbi:unnamed protein product [Diplocarpon coronariae]|nr:hypothetical protein JHW43_006927 [Diplocarpon mali]